jgi:hypothetical protein
MNFKDAFNEWYCLFEDEHGREPTAEECEAFRGEWMSDIADLYKDEKQ